MDEQMPQAIIADYITRPAWSQYTAIVLHTATQNGSQLHTADMPVWWQSDLKQLINNMPVQLSGITLYLSESLHNLS